MALAIGMGIGIPFPASSIGQAINYATTWPFADTGLTGTPWADVRRTGAATYIDSAGLVATLPDLGGGTYAARITHDPSTLARLGMLVEGQTTQLAGQTEFANGLSDAPVRGGLLTVSSLTGFAGALAFGYDGSTTTYAYKSLSASAGQVTLSAFVKMDDGGAPVLSSASSASSANDFCIVVEGVPLTNTAVIEQMSGGVYRVSASRSVSGGSSNYGVLKYAGNSSRTFKVTGYQLESGANATSYIPNSGAGTVVRVADSAGPGLALTSTALSAAFPGGVTAAFTGVIKYRKAYSVSSNETVFALSAGSSAGTTNLFALRTNGTQAQLVTSAGAGTLSGTLVHDGSTVNKIAYSCDPASGKMSISVNGATAVETTGIGYTGSGAAALIAGSQTYAGSEAMGEMIISEWDNSRTSYITGSSLQALSA